MTVRFSREDYERLQELADGATLAVYIRAKALGEDMRRQKQRRRGSISDAAALAELLGLLGQSRIANNLNQLAYHANVGTLVLDDETVSKLNEAYSSVCTMRTMLMKALGQPG